MPKYTPKHVSKGTRDFYLEELAARASKSPIGKNVEKAVGELLLHHTSLPEIIGKIDQSAGWGFLNDQGKVDAQRKALAPVYKLRVEVQKSLEENASVLMQNKPALKARDKHDAAAELRDREIRDYVRSLPDDKRARLDTFTPELLDAVVYAPAELSGIMPAVHGELRERAIEAQAPGTVAKYKAGVEALEWASETLRMVDKDLVEAGAFRDRSQYEAHIRDNIAPEVKKPFPNAVHPATGNPTDHQALLDSLAHMDKVEAEARAATAVKVGTTEWKISGTGLT